MNNTLPLFPFIFCLLSYLCAEAGDSHVSDSSLFLTRRQIEAERVPPLWKDSLMKTPDVPQKDASGNFRVGLVLSGGGAKGIAHIGVIKALEDNDIPIDCISGTSMGAVVGSLYSCGYSPAEMMALIKSPTFLNCASGTPDPDLTYYFSKAQPSPAWASVNLSFKDRGNNNITGQIIPTSLISPIPMNIEFLNLFTPFTSQCGEDFNNLMVPFRCVTSDVYHKHKIVLRSGSLGNSVRASMSFPTVFRPIEIDGVLVYDGGIYDNFPVDVMEEDFNPDFIIGVSVSGPDGKPEKNNLFSQLEDMIIQNNNYNVPSDKGIKIQCPVLNFGVLDFDKADVIYEIGYKTGLQMVDSIKKRTPARRDIREIARIRENFKSATPEIMFDSVSVTAGTPGQRRFLRFLFDRGFPGVPFGLEQTQDAYYRAVSGGKLSNLMPNAILGDVDSLPPHIRKNNVLQLAPEIKSPWNIGVGGWLTTGIQSMLFLDFGYHTLSFNSLDLDLSGWLGQSYYAGMLSGKFTVHSRFPAYAKLEAVISRKKLYDSQLMFFQENTPTFITETEKLIKLHYCLATGRKSIASSSIAYGSRRDKYYAGAVEDFDKEKRDISTNRRAVISLGWEFNTLDNETFPMAGRKIATSIWGDWNLKEFIPHGDRNLGVKYAPHFGLGADFIWREYFRLHKNFRLGASAELRGTLGPVFGEYTSQIVNSHPFSPTPSTSNYFNPRFMSDNYIAVGLMPIWNPVDKLQIRGEFYGYQPLRSVIRGANGMAKRGGWLKNPGFIGEVSAVYNFSFASLSLFCNYLSSPKGNWNFGISFGYFLLAPSNGR